MYPIGMHIGELGMLAGDLGSRDCYCWCGCVMEVTAVCSL